MSTQIATEHEEYYKQLMSQQQSDLNITIWLNWYLDCMDRALDNSEQILINVHYKQCFWQKLNQVTSNERQRKVVTRMLDNFEGHINTSKYSKLAKCSTDSALRDLQTLYKNGLLVKNAGGGRSTSYRLATFDELNKSI
jgi:Fic family protein